MNIALIGYGRMGKEIEQIALSKGHTIGLKTTKDNPTLDLKDIDVAIEFTVAKSAFQNIKTCIENNIPVISGTTGWLNDLEKINQICKEKNGTFLYASNFSLGVNLFFELNKQLAKMMAKYPYYNIEMEEIHHTKKLDAPSGTAITLAEQIIENSAYNNWSLNVTNNKNTLPIVAKREENVPGTHQIKYVSSVDKIEIKHTAFNRKGFALGALMAAEYIVDKKGIFSMADVLKLN